MMDSRCEEDEDQFFDARDEITSVSDSGSDCSDDWCSCSGRSNSVVNSLAYEFWAKTPESAHQRRNRFLKWMGLSSDPIVETVKEEAGNVLNVGIKMGFDRINEDSGAVLRNSNSEELLSNCSSVSCRSMEDSDLLGQDASVDIFLYKIKNLDDGTEYLLDGGSRLREVGSNRLLSIEEFQKTFNSSALVQQFFRRDADASILPPAGIIKSKGKIRWLKKISTKVHRLAKKEKGYMKSSGFKSVVGHRFRRIQTHSYGKKSKELSSVYAGQEFMAHKGPILTMKFSPDGQYLASAGEDGILRVWKVIEDEKPNMLDVQRIDPSSLCFSINHLSKLAPLYLNEDKIDKMKKLRKSSETACVIFPPKIFRIMEEPLHEFYGHSGEILALSWSKSGYLLSSSVDETVRLWQVGHDQCLRVFPHNNYVTCIEFNPVDENYFISGSIDGKVRIWEVHRSRVVDWIDIREMVTAVSYYPSGKGGILGTMDGSCRFYDIVDNQMQLDDEINLKGKKKLPCKRITGFEFSPSDPSKVLVTSADSQIRILHGVDVISKFKGPRISGNWVTASFTADGKHIVSASEDSNVFVWDHINQEKSSRAKNIRSCESFISPNTLIAIPWGGMKTMSESSSSVAALDLLKDSRALSSQDSSFLGLLPESLSKGSATWPEEKLLDSSLMAASPTIPKSDYKFLRSACLNACSSHMWGLVIVTAGWDGRIRTYHNYGLPL
ncbi:hypothetical protein NMG60_11026905 [Bertholletia excelsa]